MTSFCETTWMLMILNYSNEFYLRNHSNVITIELFERYQLTKPFECLSNCSNVLYLRNVELFERFLLAKPFECSDHWIIRTFPTCKTILILLLINYSRGFYLRNHLNVNTTKLYGRVVLVEPFECWNHRVICTDSICRTIRILKLSNYSTKKVFRIRFCIYKV